MPQTNEKGLQAGTPLIDPLQIHMANQEAEFVYGRRHIPSEELTEALLYARAVAGENIMLPITQWLLLPNGWVRVTIRHYRGHFILDMVEGAFRGLPRTKEGPE